MPTIPDDTKIPHSVRVIGRITAAGNLGKCNHIIYDMTCDDFDALEERSGGCCEICGIKPDRPHIDHDHSVGWNAVRGLLCPKCNAHMRRVDSGERPIEGATAEYVARPFWAARGMKPKPYISSFDVIWAAVPIWLKMEAEDKAKATGSTLTNVLERALQVYVKGGKK